MFITGLFTASVIIVKIFFQEKEKKEKKFELAYYTDDSKKGKCQYVDFENFVAIKPSVSAGRREHCFAIELRKKTYVLQAGDFQVKNLWVAKLCEVLRKGTTLLFVNTLFICYYFRCISCGDSPSGPVAPRPWAPQDPEGRSSDCVSFN